MLRKLAKKFVKTIYSPPQTISPTINPINTEDQKFSQELMAILSKYGIIYNDKTYKEILKNLLHTQDNKTLTKVLREIDNADKFTDNDLYWEYFSARSLLSYTAWDLFSSHCMETYNISNPENEPCVLEKTGLVTGKLSSSLTQSLLEAYQKAPIITYEDSDFADNFMFNPWIFGDCKKEFNQFAVYRTSTDLLKDLLHQAIETLASEFEAAIGHYFNVVGIRAFELCPLTTSIGPHIWHKDSHPAGAKKLMLYLSKTNQEVGSTEYETYQGDIFRVEGDGGEWVLFSNSRVKHRGIPPQSQNRPIIEITFMPALKTDIRINDTGQNAICPWFPTSDVTKGYFSTENTIMRCIKRSLQLGLENGNVANASDNIDNMIKR
ncbi:MAG: hypothetical protein K2W94_02685 [Alphaproteobacteria bacterium]|nr:hypothetical protein [Alphaproteobacteria bacterium]